MTRKLGTGGLQFLGIPSNILPNAQPSDSASKPRKSSRKSKSKKSPLYAWFPLACVGVGLPEPMGSPGPEFRFCPTRNWRSDFAWPEFKLLLEVHGGAFAGGGHTRGAGFRKDLEKANEAARLGYHTLAVLPEQLGSAPVFQLIADCLRNAGWTGEFKTQVNLAALVAALSRGK